MAKLFVSHAASDAPLVKAFVDLLEGGIGVRPEDIFCSSLKGQGIRPGEDFKSYIRERLKGARCAVALISPNFYGSAFCMCELGGIWAQETGLIPILIPPLKASDLRAVLVGIEALKLSDEGDLDRLRDEVTEWLSIKPLPTPRWNERQKTFLKALPDILRQLPDETSVARERHTKVLSEYEEYKLEFSRLQEELVQVRSENAELRDLKDRAEVAKVVAKYDNGFEQFGTLAAAAKDALRPLPRAVRESFYYRFARNEDYSPKESDDWGAVESAVEEGQLVMNMQDDGATPSEKDPHVRRAMKAMEDVRDWLRRAPGDFFEWYSAEHDGHGADMNLRPFWKRHFGL